MPEESAGQKNLDNDDKSGEYSTQPEQLKLVSIQSVECKYTRM